MTTHIGIAAVSPEGAALFYRQIFRQAGHLIEDSHAHPRVSLHNEPLAEYIDALQAQDWHRVGELLRRSAEVLAGCGAKLCICPDNAVQHAVHLAESGSPIPWLTMPELVARSVAADGRRVVGLIGTKLVSSGSTYQTHLGIRGVQLLVPEPNEIDEMDRIIFQELIFGEITAPSRAKVLRIVERMAALGCEGVILGSSEVPLILDSTVSPIPVYDSADILAASAVRRACGLV